MVPMPSMANLDVDDKHDFALSTRSLSPYELQDHQGDSSSSCGHVGPRQITPNLRRKSHTKSRGGCFNCKSRKIKCQETRPSCENCTTKSFACVYPTAEEQKIKRHRDELGDLIPVHPLEILSMQSTPTTFTMTDMRLFHHFLTTAYPHLPLGNDKIWKTDIPVFAHQREYLMHAVLALGASHLSRIVADGSEYTQLSLMHQNVAVRGFKEALNPSSPRIYGDYDALLATCYALTFQASYMSDGLVDFLTMVRGCALVTAQIHSENCETAFCVRDDWHMRLMSPHLDSLPPIDRSLLVEAITSLKGLEPLLQTTSDLEFYRAIHYTMTSLMTSPRQGYEAFVKVYSVWYEMGHTQFQNFVDSNNLIARMLQVHFIALQLIMIPLTEFEWPERAERVPGTLLGIVNWGEGIWNTLPERQRQYITWPLSILHGVRAEIEGKEFNCSRILTLKRRLMAGSSASAANKAPLVVEWQVPSPVDIVL